MNSNIKRQQMDDSKNEYANQLQKTNELQVSRGAEPHEHDDQDRICTGRHPARCALRDAMRDHKQIGIHQPLLLASNTTGIALLNKRYKSFNIRK